MCCRSPLTHFTFWGLVSSALAWMCNVCWCSLSFARWQLFTRPFVILLFIVWVWPFYCLTVMFSKVCWTSIASNLDNSCHVVYVFCCYCTCEVFSDKRWNSVYLKITWCRSHEQTDAVPLMTAPYNQGCSAGVLSWLQRVLGIRLERWRMRDRGCSAGVVEDGGQHLSIKLFLKACRMTQHTALNFCGLFLTKRTSGRILTEGKPFTPRRKSEENFHRISFCGT